MVKTRWTKPRPRMNQNADCHSMSMYSWISGVVRISVFSVSIKLFTKSSESYAPNSESKTSAEIRYSYGSFKDALPEPIFESSGTAS